MKLWYTNNSPFTSYTTVAPHSESRRVMREYEAGEGVPCFDKLMSGSSLEGKAF